MESHANLRIAMKQFMDWFEMRPKSRTPDDIGNMVEDIIGSRHMSPDEVNRFRALVDIYTVPGKLPM